MNQNYTGYPGPASALRQPLTCAVHRDAPTLSEKFRNVTVPYLTHFPGRFFVTFKLGSLFADNERFLFQRIFLATGNLESRFKTKHKMLRMFKAVFLIIVLCARAGVRIRTMPGPVFTSLARGHSCSIAMHCPGTLPATITQYKNAARI